MLTVICYDISEDACRNRVAKHLERRAVRVQYSVFEAWLTVREADNLAKELAPLLESTDSLRFYAVGQFGLRRSFSLGQLPISLQPGLIIV
jgi:CRISPR-associated protein Cas2